MPRRPQRLAAAFACASLFLIPSAHADMLEIDLGRGPIPVHYPADNGVDAPAPLLVLLHGYSANGTVQEEYFNLLPIVEREGVIYAIPDGLTDVIDNQFWNGTDACCDLFATGVDDSTYLFELVSEIRRQLAVDPWRVHFVGHSNGGFMSYRMACDHADVIASIGSLAGATFDDPAACVPVGPVHVLQVHGTEDQTILYDEGGAISGTPYPGALRTTETWAASAQCDLEPDESAPPLDLEADLPGAESTVLRYRDGCVPASSAELWTIPSGSHVPNIADGFREGIVGFALTHPKAGVVFTDAQTLAWPPLRWAERYRVYRGNLADLSDRDGDGLPDSGYGECVSDGDPDPTDTTLLVDDEPPPGGGWFYVVGFVEADGTESLLGTTSEGRARWPQLSCP